MTISESSRVSLEAFGLQRVSVITPPGAVATTWDRPPLKERVPTVIFVGRLAANKRPDHAVEAFSEIRRLLPDAQLWVVGDGELGDRLARRKEPGVTLFGHVDQAVKLDLMSRAHVLVATSVREGWGMVVDEAAGVGTPTVAYDVAGLRDSVARAGGVLVEASPSALAERLVELLPVLAADPSRLRPVQVRRDWDDVAADMLVVVEHVTNSRDTRRVAP
jgi:glycosyltransferase involved in cell wall biosynthesis